MNLLLSDPAFLSVAATVSGGGGYDPDAAAYIAAVEAADGQALEEPVKVAIDNFVLGCKADGIWNAIKASCILAGARTLNGALVPLVGAAPTNFNFVADDYNRKTGLVGNGSTKYLNSNRNNNVDPPDNRHLAFAYSSVSRVAGTAPPFGGAGSENGRSFIIVINPGIAGNLPEGFQSTLSNLNGTNIAGALSTQGFVGISRSSSSTYTARGNGANTTVSQTSQTPANADVFIFRRVNGVPTQFSSNRLTFYSIGEALDLALLDARVTTLINAFAAAIP